MATPTYTALATTTLGASASSVTFSSIPATYRDLVLVVQILQNTTGSRQAVLRPNGDTSNASLVFMDGGVLSGTASQLSMYFATGIAANSPVTSIVQIMDYAQTDKHKTMLTRAGSGFDPVSAYASRWASTTAISSLNIVASSGGAFSIGSTLSLFGIEA